MNASAENTTSMSAGAEWFDHADDAAWSQAVADAVGDCLREDLARHARVVLLVSGGTTPGPVLARLARQPLDWARVVVSLVDERWTQADAIGSNSRQVKDRLLRDDARSAEFWPLIDTGRDIETCVDDANRRIGTANVPVSVALLGMGSDGHTASLFPGARNLDEVWLSPKPYAFIDATGISAAQQWPLRISSTPSGLALAGTRFLLLRGQEKREVLERVLRATDAKQWPIRVVLGDKASPLRVYWCG